MIFRQGVRGMNSVLQGVSSLLLVYLIGAAVLDGALRWTTDHGVQGTIEWGTIALAALTFLSLSPTQERREHVMLDLVVEHLPTRAASIVEAVGLFIALAFVVWTAYASTRSAIVSVIGQEATIGLVTAPVWLGRVAVAVGWWALALTLLLQTVDLARGKLPYDVGPADALAAV